MHHSGMPRRSATTASRWSKPSAMPDMTISASPFSAWRLRSTRSTLARATIRAATGAVSSDRLPVPARTYSPSIGTSPLPSQDGGVRRRVRAELARKLLAVAAAHSPANHRVALRAAPQWPVGRQLPLILVRPRTERAPGGVSFGTDTVSLPWLARLSHRREHAAPVMARLGGLLDGLAPG